MTLTADGLGEHGASFDQDLGVRDETAPRAAGRLPASDRRAVRLRVRNCKTHRWTVQAPRYVRFVTSVSAELKGHAFDLDALCRLFASDDPVVVKNADRYFLVSEGLNRHAHDASALYAEADTIVRYLNGVGRADSTDFRLIELSGTFEVLDSQGSTVHQVVAVGSFEVRARATATAVVTRADGSVVEEPSKPQRPRIAVIADRNPDVSEVLTLLAAPRQDWVILYKIYEVVRDAVGCGQKGLVDAGLMTAQEQSAFTGSANHPSASGSAARHARQPGGAPKITMSLADGQEFIRRVVNAWAEALPG